ncbi:UNVERIFIED_ORG: hypothetical protein E4P37_07880 [Bacillus sp. AZ43]
MIMPVLPAVVQPRPRAEGHALHSRLLAEARAVVAGVLTSHSTPEDVAVALHRVAGGDISDEALSVLSEVLAA